MRVHRVAETQELGVGAVPAGVSDQSPLGPVPGEHAQRLGSIAVPGRDEANLADLVPGIAAVVSRAGDESYGVYIALSSAHDVADVTCRWEPDRVVIVEPNGIEHTVPASVFSGGR